MFCCFTSCCFSGSCILFTSFAVNSLFTYSGTFQRELNAPNQQRCSLSRCREFLNWLWDKERSQKLFGLQWVLKHELQDPALSSSPGARACSLGRVGTGFWVMEQPKAAPSLCSRQGESWVCTDQTLLLFPWLETNSSSWCSSSDTSRLKASLSCKLLGS